jgi:hypothetical protein
LRLTVPAVIRNLLSPQSFPLRPHYSIANTSSDIDARPDPRETGTKSLSATLGRIRVVAHHADRMIRSECPNGA